MAAVLERNIVSDGEILSQLSELQVLLPRAGDLRRAVVSKKLSTRDAVYFLLLEALDLRRRAVLRGPVSGAVSQGLPAECPEA